MLLGMDVLSLALGSVRMTGAIFSDLACTAPWGFNVPELSVGGPSLAPGTERLVSFHVVTEGEALVRLDGDETLVAGPGDVIVLPRGDAHSVANGAPTQFYDSGVTLEQLLSGLPAIAAWGGGGPTTKIICGFFGCGREADRSFLAGLPRVFKISLRNDPAGVWLEQSVVHLVGEAQARDPGSSALLTKMAEVLLVEALRRYMRDLPDEHGGWLAGARDPIVGAALAAIHEHPGRAWTIAELTAEVGASRSVLQERFAKLIGEPPLSYLTHWRMLLAARQLEATEKTVLEVALDVGYQSEAAFNRAFKREHGAPPAAYRKQRRQTEPPADSAGA